MDLVRGLAIAAIVIASSVTRGDVRPSNRLTPVEVRELRYLDMRRRDLQKAIDEYQAERGEVEARIRKAHGASDRDRLDSDAGLVVRAPAPSPADAKPAPAGASRTP